MKSGEVGASGMKWEVENRKVLWAIYHPNELNPYEAIHMGAKRTAVGRAPVGMGVEVNGDLASRVGEIYYQEVSGANASGPDWKEVVTEDGSDGDPSVTNFFWFDDQTTSPSYDDDGNLVNDGRWVYSWDAENRLIQMETTPAATTAGHPFTKLVFVYDGLGRRISRTVYRGSATTHESTTRWLYDGWNPVTEFSAPSELSTTMTRRKAFTWGLDVSGSMQGAGGVGGLLAQGDLSSGEVYRATYDGNGNVMCWMEKDEVTVRWRGEYDAFGNVAVSEGENPSEYGFSTKVRDRYTGLSYYGYRYYDPVTGRWPSRDPIEEEGGVNLYGFVGNDGVNRGDLYGLAGWGGAFGDFADWISGEHDANTTHGPNDQRTQNLRGSDSVAKLREFLLNKNKRKCENWEGVTNYAEDFKPWDQNFWSDLDNGSVHFVGSFSAEVEIVREWTEEVHSTQYFNKSWWVEVKFTITNSTTIASFFRFIPWADDSWNNTDTTRDDFIPGDPYGPGFLEPGSNWNQTYTWNETYNPCKKCYTKFYDCRTGEPPTYDGGGTGGDYNINDLIR